MLKAPPDPSDILDDYVKRLKTGNGPRPTLEEFLVEKGRDVLPSRYAKDISRLVSFLDTVVFEEKLLKRAEDPENERFEGMQATIPKEKLVRGLGANFETDYHYRDWTTAVETLLKERGYSKTPNFGQDYRIGMDWDGPGTVFINIKSNIYSACEKAAPGQLLMTR
jgi:hypothetical protein